MAKAIGKRVVHLDVDCRTLHIDLGQLDHFLISEDPLDTILLTDHTFGNPFPLLATVRHKYPDLLIIEDSVRALGARIAGETVHFWRAVRYRRTRRRSARTRSGERRSRERANGPRGACGPPTCLPACPTCGGRGKSRNLTDLQF